LPSKLSGNVSGSSPDEFCPSDEVKVFKDEGEDESEQNASECLQAELLEEEKSSLIKESEQVGTVFLLLSFQSSSKEEIFLPFCRHVKVHA
jgi:hypothetical protein